MLPDVPLGLLRRGVEEAGVLSGKVALVTGSTKMKLLGEEQPSLEFATPEQIGAAALFLCSQAAAKIRCIALPVDRGWIAQ